MGIGTTIACGIVILALLVVRFILVHSVICGIRIGINKIKKIGTERCLKR